MKTILFFSSASRHSCRKRVAGVQRYFHDPDLHDGARFTVDADLVGSATLAAKELLALNLSHYAFVGFSKPLFWSRVREKAFVEAINLNGATCHVFAEANDPDIRRVAALRKWLKHLPKPCGLFAAFDGTAEEVLAACQQEQIAVPDDIAVLGVDNNEEICEQTKPTLSSICPDFEKAGFLSGELLDLQLQDPKAKAQSRTFGLLGVVRRRSTKLFSKTDPKVTDALEFIRLHACERIRVEDVAKVMGCSKRMAEIRFSRLVKHTIAEEIREVRMARVFTLLRNPNQAIDAIANLCGYESDSTLRYAFKARTGLSMREWRKRKDG